MLTAFAITAALGLLGLAKAETTERIQVLVTVPDGPVRDAHVLVATRDPRTTALGRTNSHGLFEASLALTANEAVDVLVHADGYETWIRRSVLPNSKLTALLGRAHGVLSGTVRDADTKLPIPQARVLARSTVVLSLLSDDTVEFGMHETETNTDGRFSFDAVSSGSYSVSVSSEGYGQMVAHGANEGQADLGFYLFRGYSIVGTIVDSHKNPMEGATVLAYSVSRPQLADRFHSTSADDGTYRISGLEPGEYLLFASHRGLAPKLTSRVIVDAAGPRTVANTQLEVGAEVHGRLLNAEDAEIRSGIAMITVLDGEALPQLLREQLSEAISADGDFRFGNLPRGYHTMRLAASGFLREELDFSVGDRQAEVDLGDVQLSAGYAVAGFVTTLDGAPLSGMHISAKASGRAAIAREHGYSLSGEAISGDDGMFVLGGLEEAIYTITANGPGYGVSRKEQVSVGDSVHFRLERVGGIVGRVVDAEGNAVYAFDISCRNTNQAAPTSFHYVSVSNAAGSFRIPDLARGSYSLRVNAGEYGSKAISDILVEPRVDRDVGTIQLDSTGTLIGSVIDASSDPVVGAVVSATSLDGSTRRTTTESNGSFELEGVRKGRITVLARHPKFADEHAIVEIVDKSRVETTLVLTAGGSVEGTVLDREGRGVPGRVIVTRSRDTPVELASLSTIEPRNFAVSGSDGTFRIDGVRLGPVVAELFSPSLLTVPIQSEGIEVFPGSPTPVTFVSRQVRIEGQVTRQGAPAPSVLVSLTPTTVQGQSRVVPGVLTLRSQGIKSDGSYGGVSDMDGRFETVIDAPGPHLVIAESVDGSFRGASRWLEIPDAPVYSLQLEFGDVRISGRVEDLRTKRPIEGARLLSATTDSDGRFHFMKEVGQHRILVRAAGYATETVDFEVKAQGAPPHLLVSLTPERAITGQILSGGEHGVSDIPIVATPATPAHGHVRYSLSQANGSFAIHDVEATVYTLFAASQTHGFAVGSADANSQPAVLHLQPGVTVELLVVDSDGQIADGAEIQLVGVDGVPVPSIVAGTTDSFGILRRRLPVGDLQFAVRIGLTEVRHGEIAIPQGLTATVSFAAELRLADPE